MPKDPSHSITPNARAGGRGLEGARRTERGGAEGGRRGVGRHTTQTRPRHRASSPFVARDAHADVRADGRRPRRQVRGPTTAAPRCYASSQDATRRAPHPAPDPPDARAPPPHVRRRGSRRVRPGRGLSPRVIPFDPPTYTHTHHREVRASDGRPLLGRHARLRDRPPRTGGDR